MKGVSGLKLPDWSFLDEDLAGQVGGLDERIQQVLAVELTDHLADLLTGIDECETPIEELLCVALNARRNSLLDRMHGFWAELNPQFMCETQGGKYRTDFRVVLVEDGTDRGVSVCVECDGHDFHEKTKAQAARDKKRDRDLAAKGTPVLHYTGSEIWRNPEACAREVMARLRGRWNELYADR